MEELSLVIASNLKRLRTQRGLSLGQLAEMSGLSKVLLSQIEKGHNNPTIQTIWKIANSLNVPYSALLDAPRDEMRVVTHEEALSRSQPTGDAGFRVLCYYPSSPHQNFELFSLEIEPDGDHISPEHPQNSIEYLYVQKGTLRVTVGDRVHELRAGDCLRFSSDQPHEYRNIGETKVRAVTINFHTI